MAEIHYSNPSQLGSVPPEDVDFLRQIVAGWESDYKQLLEAKGLSFVMGTQNDVPPEPGKVYVSKLAIDLARKEPAMRAAARPGEHIPSLSTSLLNNALVAALGEGPESINWEAVRKEMLYQQEHVIGRNMPPNMAHVAKINLEGVRRNLQGPRSVAYMLFRAASMFEGDSGDTARRRWPELSKAYDAYHEFIDNAIGQLAAQQRDTAPSRINIVDRAIAVIEGWGFADSVRRNMTIRFDATDELEARAVAAAIVCANNNDRSVEGHLTLGLDDLMKQQQFHYDPASRTGSVTLLASRESPIIKTDLMEDLRAFKEMYKLGQYKREGQSSEKLLFEECKNVIQITPLRPKYGKHLAMMQGRLLEFIGQHHGLDVRCPILPLPEHLQGGDNEPINPSNTVTEFLRNPEAAQKKYFTIPNNTSPEQREIFKALNRAIDKLGISAGELDQQFRMSLMRLIVLTGNSATPGVLEKMPPDSRKYLEASAQYRALAECESEIHQTFQNQFPLSVMLNRPWKEDMILAAPQVGDKITQDLAAALDNKLGRFQDVNATVLEGVNRSAYEQFGKAVSDRKNLQPSATPATENLMQTLANPDPPILSELKCGKWSSGGVTYEAAMSPALYAGRCLFEAVTQVAAAKGWSIARQKEELDDISKTIINNVNVLLAQQQNLSAPVPTSGALPDRYTYAENLPKAQKRFFDALNEVVELTGEPAVAFDHNLRLKLYTNFQSESADMMLQLHDYFHDQLPGINLQTVQLGGEGYKGFSDRLKSTLKRNQRIGEAREILNTLHSDIANAALQIEAQKSMHRFVMQYLPGYEQLHLGENRPLHNEHINTFTRNVRKLLGADAITNYTGQTLLLEPFASGKNQFSTLAKAAHTSPVSDYFEVSHVPLSRFLIEAIESTAHFLASDNRRDNSQLRDALKELRSAYQDVLLTPQELQAKEKAEKAAAAEAERRRKDAEAETTRRKEEALLAFIPYGISAQTPLLQGIETRATRQEDRIKRIQPPEKELADAWAQIQSLPTTLNRNFLPHLELGNALFTKNDEQVLPMLDHICTGKELPNISLEARTKTRDALIHMLVDPIETLAPEFKTKGIREQVIEANRKQHQEVLEALANAPLLIIAALGSGDHVRSARDAQRLLFPPGRKASPSAEEIALARYEIWNVAGNAVSEAFEAAGKTPPEFLINAIHNGMVREEKAAEEAAQADAQTKAAAAEAKAKAAAKPKPPSVQKPSVPPTTPPESPEPPPVVPPLVIPTAALAAAATDAVLPTPPVISPPDQQPQPATESPTIADPPIATTKRGNGSRDGDNVMDRLDAFIQKYKKEGYDMLRCNLSLKDGYPLTVSLSRAINGEKSGPQRIQTHSITLPLNKQDIEEALQLKQEIQTRLLAPGSGIYPYRRLHEDHILTGSDSPLPFRSPERNEAGLAGHLSRRGGLRTLKFEFPGNGEREEHNGGKVRMHGEMSLGIKQDGDEREAIHRQELVSKYIDKLLDSPEQRHFTMQDLRLMLQDKVKQEGGKWELAKRINLARDYPEIETQMIIDFPSREEQTIIQVGNPVLEGSPNPFWRIPLLIGTVTRESEGPKDWRLISKPSVNTHVSDSDTALSCIENILEHLKESLENHAGRYSGATWRLTDKDQLDHTSPNISGNVIHIDGAAWDQIVARLGYVAQTSAHVSDITKHGDRTHFKLTLRRADGTPFLARTNLPVEYDCSVATRGTAQETREAITAFHQKIQAKFRKYLDTHFKGHEEEVDGKPVYHPIKEYKALSIANGFDGIVEAVAPQSGVEATRQRISGVSGNGGYKPGDPKEHHAELNYEDGTFHRNRLKNRNPGFGHNLP